MNIETTINGSISILHIDGKIIGDAVGILKSEIEKQSEQSDGKLILDLVSVPLMDSSALGTIVSALTHLKKVGGKLVLLSPQKAVGNVLAITRLDSIFEIYQDLQDAISSFE